jgi:hypothetical protein
VDNPSKPLGRNEPCHCKSGKKYKQCCLEKDEAAAREARETARAAAQAAAVDAPPPTDEVKPKTAHRGHVPHGKEAARSPTNTRGFQKSSSTPRKVGGG